MNNSRARGMNNSLSRQNPKRIPVKTAKKRLSLVDGEFTIDDLLSAMNNRRVLGSYHRNAAKRAIHKGIRCNLVKKINVGNHSAGECDTYKKI